MHLLRVIFRVKSVYYARRKFSCEIGNTVEGKFVNENGSVFGRKLGSKFVGVMKNKLGSSLGVKF